MILAIDQGANGGLAWMDKIDNAARCEKMAEGMTGYIDQIKKICLEDKIKTAYIEKVGFHIQGNAASASCKFARHCGHIEATLYMLGVSVVDVNPKTWQKHLGTLPEDKAERKRAIKELMARRYPWLDVTLKTADALGILTYAIEVKNGM